MVFNFNPPLWFVCRLCRRSFTDTEKLKEHKIACHLGECMHIKAIIFEERLVYEEWTAAHKLSENKNRISSSVLEMENSTSLKQHRNKFMLNPDLSSKPSFKNPLVSLIKIKEDETFFSISQNNSNSNFQYEQTNPSEKNLLKRSSSPESKEIAKEYKLIKQEQTEAEGTDCNMESTITDNYYFGPQTSCPNDGDHLEHQIQVKQEAPIFEVSTFANAIEIVNEGAEDNLEDLKVPVLIGRSVFPRHEEVPGVQLPLNLIPTSAREYQRVQEKIEAISKAVLNLDAIFVKSEHQELISSSEANDSNWSSSDVEFKINSSYSELSDSSSSVSTENHETKTRGSNQHTKAASRLKLKSKVSTDKSVEKPFKCESCSASFRTIKTLRSQKLSHSSIKSFKCSKCSSKFKRGSELNRHQVVHGNKSKFKCRFCKKSFGDTPNLLAHERIHTGDKPFKCPVNNCDYATLTKSNLNSHTRAMHSEELGLQQFVCPTCEKIYGLKKSLDQHMRTVHSNARPFCCTHKGCKMKFKLRDYLQKHSKIHHS